MTRIIGALLGFCPGETMLVTPGGPDLTRGVEIHEGDAKADDAGPDRIQIERRDAGDDDGEGIVARRQEGCLGQAAAVMTVARQQKRRDQAEGERAEAPSP